MRICFVLQEKWCWKQHGRIAFFVISHFLVQKGNRRREEISQFTTKQLNSGVKEKCVVKRYHTQYWILMAKIPIVERQIIRFGYFMFVCGLMFNTLWGIYITSHILSAFSGHNFASDCIVVWLTEYSLHPAAKRPAFPLSSPYKFDFQPSNLTCGEWEKTSYSFTLIHSHTTHTVVAFCPRQYTNSLVTVTHLNSRCNTMYDCVILGEIMPHIFLTLSALLIPEMHCM